MSRTNTAINDSSTGSQEAPEVSRDEELDDQIAQELLANFGEGQTDPNLIEAETASEGEVEAGRAKIAAVSDIPEPVENAETKEPPAKPEAESSSAEELASLIAIVEDIDDDEKLQALSDRCSQAGLLSYGTTKHGYWVKAKTGISISKELVEAINDKKTELAIKRVLEKIEGITDPDKLENYAYFLDDKRGLIKKINIGGRGWKIEAIDAIKGSKKIVNVIIKRRSEISTFREQMEAIEGKKSGGELEKTAQRLHYARYVIKKGEKENFTVTAGKKFGGKELAKAIMDKKKIFVDPLLKASMGAILAEHLGKK